MEREKFVQFADSMPMRQGCGSEKRLDTRNAERWIFRNKYSFRDVVVILFLLFMLFPLLCLTQMWGTISVFSLLLLVIFLLRKFSKTAVFDFENKCFHRSRKPPRYGDLSTLKDYLPFSQIAGVQFLYKVVHGHKGHSYH